MKNKIFLLLLLLAAAAARTGVSAQDGAVTGPETVIVPFDVTKPLESQKPSQVYISYERFVELWEAAKANKRGIPAEDMAQSYILSSARYDAKLDDGSLHVTGVIDLLTFKDDWTSVPIAFRDVKIGVLKLDGQPALLASGGVVIEKAGRHRVEVEFEIPVGDAKARNFNWGIPVTAGTLFSITLPDKQMKAGVSPGNGVVERINGEQKIVTAALGSTDHVDLQLDSSVGLSTITQAAVAKIDTSLSITPAVELVHSGFEFSFPESQQDHFAVSLDKALALVKLDVPNLKSWKLTVGADSQVLEITLTEPARRSFKFSIDAERTSTEQQRHFPYISATANRIEETSVLYTTPFLDVTPQPTTALRQISFGAQQNTGLRLVAAYASTGDKELLAYGVQPAKLSNKAEISYVYQVNHTKIELVAALKLRIKNATLFDVSLGLPGDFVVQAVESDRLKDWWREGDTLHVRFKGDAPDAVTPLVLHLVKLFKAVPDALEIKPLTLPDTWEVEGNGIIAASSAVQAQMTITEAKEINPENAATDFRILPPMERKRGFSFKGQTFHASVKLDTLPPRVNGTWVMSAQAHESWVSVSTYASFTARQGSAPGASFRLPASTPEARVTGDNVRETTSAVDGNWRVYHVAFQNDLTDQTGFAIDFDLPGTGSVSLPAFEFLEVERSDGFVIVDNASEYEMQVDPSGLDVALSSQIPFLPQVSRNARLFRAQPGWKLQIGLTKLEKEAGRSVFVDLADLTTAIRADGTEWYSATYHLQNRSLQFLPVKLPAGSELVSVSVADDNVRADQGKVDGKEVLLVPLIKTQLGDLPYEVRLVYRKMKKAGFWTFSREKLADPELVGITVERTIWSLYVPEGSNAGNFGGNMEESTAEVNEIEKQEGKVDLIKRLDSVASDINNSIEIRQKAEENSKKVAKTLEDSSQVARNRDGVSDLDQLDRKQSSYLFSKRVEIQNQVQEEKKTFETNMTNAQQAVAKASPQQHAVQKAGGNATQTWAYNGSYVADEKGELQTDKAKEIDRKNPEGRQLYVNDYVVNVQAKDDNAAAGVPVQSGSVSTYYSRGILQGPQGAVSGNNTYTGGTALAAGGNLNFGGANNYTGSTTVVNGGVLNISGGTATVSGTLSNSEAMVQDEVTQIQSQQALQRQAQAKPQAENANLNINAAAGGQVTSGLRSGGEAISGEAMDRLLTGNPNAITVNGAGGTASQATSAGNGYTNNVKILNNARGNTDANSLAMGANQAAAAQLQEDAQAAASATPAAGADLAVDAGEVEKLGIRQMQGQGGGGGQGVVGQFAVDSIPKVPTSAVNGLSDVAGSTSWSPYNSTTSQGQVTPVLRPPSQLQPAGAISLPIDFPIPTDGHVYHFKKLKANASLTFWVTNEQRLDKWKWLLVFVVAGILTAVVFKIIDLGYIPFLRRRVVHI